MLMQLSQSWSCLYNTLFDRLSQSWILFIMTFVVTIFAVCIWIHVFSTVLKVLSPECKKTYWQVRKTTIKNVKMLLSKQLSLHLCVWDESKQSIKQIYKEHF